MKKRIFSMMILLVLIAGLVGCGDKKSATITVTTREDGSGTRGAFEELFGIKDKGGIIASAEETNSTTVMMTSVAGNANAIGYVSLGSLLGAGDSAGNIKAVKIDGAEATVENIKNGSYKIARPFNVAVKEDCSDLAKDFMKFIMSAEGQKVVEDAGYISQGNEGAYAGSQISGKLTVGGSSSVTPVMTKLAEAYKSVNPNAEVTVIQSDSTSGMNNTVDGTYDIGMASRNLKDSEKEAGLKDTAIALDGVAVIINGDNEVDNLTTEQVMKIYTGEVTTWDEVK